MQVAIGNWLYILIILGLFLVIFLLIIFTKRRSYKFNYWFIFSILMLNFVLHFLKIFLPFENYFYGLPYSLMRISFENICAVSVAVFPFIYLSKNNYLKDVMIIVGIMSGLLVYFIPSQALVTPLDSVANCVEIFRFYFCHAPLVICPILMLSNHMHKFSYKRVPFLPLIFYSYFVIVFINKVIFAATGLLDVDIYTFFSRDDNNPSFVFGISSNYDNVLGWTDYLIPSIFKYIDPNGVKYYTPILWLIPFTYPVLLIALYSFMYLIGDRRNMKIVIAEYKQKIKLAKAK